MKHCEVAVIGGGIMGAATAASLASRGREVILFERFDVGHTAGSSHGSSRIFRLSYPEDRYVALAQEALELWRRWSADLGEELLVTTGGIDTGYEIEANAAALEACDATYELLDADSAAAMWPSLRFSTGSVLFQADAGIVRADLAWRAFVRAATDRGARFLSGQTVEALDVSGEGVIIRTGAGTTRAQVAVVTAGPWARPLLASADIDLPVVVTRETVAHFSASDEMTYPTIVDWADQLIYALPSPGIGIKVGEHHAGPVANPDEPGAPDIASVERISEWVRERYPKVNPTPAVVETCFYTSTPNEDFVLERHGDIVVGSPCSGHGFKFAPSIGERLADLAVG